MPNKIRTWRPQTNELLSAFDNVNVVEFHDDGVVMSDVTTLNSTQVEILEILGVPEEKYSLAGKSSET